jgi:hypothetical protein
MLEPPHRSPLPPASLPHPHGDLRASWEPIASNVVTGMGFRETPSIVPEQDSRMSENNEVVMIALHIYAQISIIH